jgi:hypothetical protein
MSAIPDAVAITLFSDRFAKTKNTERWPISKLAQVITLTTADDKTALPLLKLATFGNARSNRSSFRHDANVATVSGIEADYDGGDLPISHAINLLEQRGLWSIVYTSPSHTEDKPRWRVLCPFSQEMEPTRRRHMAGRLNGLFRGIFARETFALSQAYYFGSVRKNPSHQVHVVDGNPIDWDSDLDAVWIGPAESTTGEPGSPEGTATADSELIRQIATGENFHVPLCAIASRYIGRGVPPATVEELLRGLLLSHPPESRDQRWVDRFDDLGTVVASAARKYQATAEQRRALAALAGRLIRAGRPEAEILAEIDAAALAAGVAPEIARRTLEWVVQQELAKLSGGRSHG